MQIDILVVSDPEVLSPPVGVALVTFAEYHASDFEETRADLVGKGLTLKGEEHSATDFLETVFHKVLKHSGMITIADKQLQPGDNFDYTIRVLLAWMTKVIDDPARCKIVLHCTRPAGSGAHHLETLLHDSRMGRIASLPIEIQYYDSSGTPQWLPHDRFLVTDQVGLSLGRGMDFLNRATRKNRDITVNYVSTDEVEALLATFAHSKSGSPVTI